jgi:hypothetical protein
MDLFQASVGMKKPDFGLCRSYLTCLESDLPVMRQRHREETTMPFSFPVAVLEDQFQDLLWDIRCYLDMIKAYYSGTWSRAPNIPLALCRNLIQHRLLSLDQDASNGVREVCRVSILLFSCVVVYPLQNLAPMQRYLEELAHLLKMTADIEDNFRLWLLFLGAMASDQMPVQSWYVSELRMLAPKYGMRWTLVKKVLEGFLWLDIACGEGALEVWQLVLAVR